jgi:hypothetical protein
MDVSAECPGGSLFGDDQREFAAASLGIGDQGLSGRFVMKNQAGMSGGVQRVDVSVRSIGQADDGEGFFCTSTDNLGIAVDRHQMAHFERGKPAPMFSEFA